MTDARIATPEWAIQLDDVSKEYPIPRSARRGGRSSFVALERISMLVPRGHTVGIVGESGSGKSTLGQIALTASAPTTGRVYIDDVEVRRLRGAQLRAARRRVQAVFQDPGGALDPRRTVMQSMLEPLRAGGLPGTEARERAARLLTRVGIDPGRAGQRPATFSGGQRQRITIARALAADPSVLIADEPVSALDVSVQAQVLNLFRDLQQRERLTMLFVSHDLGVVSYIADTVMVMRDGLVVEAGPASQILHDPRHPYTRTLREAAVGALDQSSSPPPVPTGGIRCEIAAPGLERTADGRLLRRVDETTA